jgi:CHAT domain-containing protein
MNFKQLLLKFIYYLGFSLIFALAIRIQIARSAYSPPIIQPAEVVPAITTEQISGDINAAVQRFEESQVAQFSTYLGIEFFGKISSLEQTCQTLDELSQATDTKPALIYVVSHLDKLELLLILPSCQRVRRVIPEANRQVIDKVAQDFRTQIINPIADNSRNSSSAQQLYRWIVTPLEAELQANQIKSLVFCMDVGLRSIPLAALYNGQQFLIEQYSVALIPSFSLTDTRYQRLENLRLLAMGISKSTQKERPLPAVVVEVSNLTSQLWQGKALLDEDSTVNNFKAANRQERFGIIHMATHAEFQPGRASNSYVQFWDEKLRLEQLRQLSLELEWEAPPKIEMLVLSACRSALGDAQAELGFTGLAVQAGVKSALGSLWYVSDESTMALMAQFYQQLKTAKTRVEALRQAQLAMLKGEVRIQGGQLRLLVEGQEQWILLPAELNLQDDLRLSHPYYWSAFTMIGNWN